MNRDAIGFLHERRAAYDDLDAVLVGGILGPRGDGYVPGERLSPEEYADYHRPQLASFRAADADCATVLTLTGADEATGVVAAARDVGLPVAVGFTVETDGRLPDGTALADAIAEVDAAGGPDWFLVNCAHPTHIAPGLDGDGPWDRIKRAAAQRQPRCRTPSWTPRRSSTRATRRSSRARSWRWSAGSRRCASWAVAAARTPAMSPPCGASEKLFRCPKTGSCTSSTRSPSCRGSLT